MPHIETLTVRSHFHGHSRESMVRNLPGKHFFEGINIINVKKQQQKT